MTLKEFDKKYKIEGARNYRLSAKKVAEQMIARQESFDIYLKSEEYNKLMKLTGYSVWLSERSLTETVV